MKKKSILKGASFFLATFAFCGVMALGAKYISPRHEVNTTIETQVAYAEELATLDKTLWDSFKRDNGETCYYNVTKIVTLTNETDTTGATQIGENAYARISGDTLSIFSTNSSKIILPENCSNLFWYGVTIDNFGWSSFFNVTTVDLSNFDTSNVTNMNLMLGEFFSATSINLNGFDTSNVTNMSQMFIGCWSLTSLDVSGFNTSNVTSMESMFYGCNDLTSLDLSGFDTSKVENMEGMFHVMERFEYNGVVYCDGISKLKQVDLSSFDMTNVTNANDMFYGCDALVDIVMPKALPTSVTQIDLPNSMFVESDTSVGSNNLMDFNDPAYLSDSTTKKVITTMPANTLGADAWKTYKNDNQDTISSQVTKVETKVGVTDTTGATRLGKNIYAKINGDTLTIFSTNENKIILPADCSEFFYKHYNGCIFSNVTTMDLSNFDTSNVTNMSYMFYLCEALTSLDLSGFDTTNVTNMSYMFDYCLVLTSLDLSGFNTSNVTSMAEMFYACGQLYKLDISSFDLSNVTNASHVFDGDYNLRKIYLPRVVSDSVNIDLPYTYHTQSWNYSGSYLNDFRYTLSDDNTKRYIVTDSVESQEAVIDGTEWNKFKNDNFNGDIKKIVTKKAYDPYNYTRTLGENVYAYINGDTCEIYTRLDTKILLPEDCRNMFKGLENVTDIDLSACDTSDVTNIDSMFELCSALENVNLSGFDTSKVTNMAEMFCDCGNLKEVDISNFITSQVTDIHGMFYGCNSLKVVDLSSFDLTNVNTNQLFDGCENLSMIYLPKALPQGYDVELGSDLVLASNHAVKGSTLNAFAGYESTAGQKNAIVKGGEVNVVVDTQFADVISTGEEIEYYYGDEIVVNGTTLIIGGVSVQVIPNEVEGYEITFAGWEGIENGVVVGDTITAILTKTPINYTITMIVNGQNNTRKYNIETNTFTLEEPEGGEEEEFVGWTWEGQEVPVKDLEILKGSIGDRTVKANFAPKTYTITINVDGEITTIDYTKGSDDIVIKDPSSSGLIFDGWVDENGNKVDENVIKSGSTGDRYFKATWKKSPMLKYVAIGVLAFVGVAVATEIIVGVLVKKKKK